MNNDTSKTSRTAAPLDAKPDLVKRIGNTTFLNCVISLTQFVLV